MNPTILYTPLESLLLFQSLVAYGTEDQDILRISELLTHNPLVKSDETYDAQRLTPDALKGFYVQLLLEELKADKEDGPATTKKRKLQSPPLPSVVDAHQHREKLPILVDRLYARYREHMIAAIREDERQYAAIQQEIEEIERGEWDDRIREDDRALAEGLVCSTTSEPKANGAGKESLLDASSGQKSLGEGAENVSIASPRIDSRPEDAATNNTLSTQEPPPQSRKAPEASQNSPVLSQPKSASNGPHGPSPLQPPQPSTWKWEPTFTPHAPPYPPGGPYPQFNTPNHPSHGPPQGFAPPSAPFLPPHGLNLHSQVPSSPAGQQQQHGMLQPSPNPNGHRTANPSGMSLDALADQAGNHRMTSRSPSIQGPPTSGVFPHPYPPQQRPSNGPPLHWNQSPQFASPFPGLPQPYPLPPNSHSSNIHLPNQHPPPLSQTSTQAGLYNSPYNGAQGSRPPLSQSQTPKYLPNVGPTTPLSSGHSRFTTGCGTRWTPVPTGTSPGIITQVDSPSIEPLSPVLRPTKTPHSSKTAKKESKKSEAPKPVRRGAQRTRAASTASSAIADSQRSQSVMSHEVKEEVATPMGIEDPDDNTTDENLTSKHAILHSTKRKRASSVALDRPSGPATHVLWTRAFPKISHSALETIIGHRDASTFAAPVKERDAPGYKKLILRPQDLKSIKSAITAGARAATAAAPEDLNPNASSAWLPISEDLMPPKGIINYAQLEKELMRMFANAIMFNADPDRGFGPNWNSIGQGKGDVVGYEIDEDSVVKDTKHMFKDVETIVGNLRSAERRSEEMEMRESSVTRAEVDDDIDELAEADSTGASGRNTKRSRKG